MFRIILSPKSTRCFATCGTLKVILYASMELPKDWQQWGLTSELLTELQKPREYVSNQYVSATAAVGYRSSATSAAPAFWDVSRLSMSDLICNSQHGAQIAK